MLILGCLYLDRNDAALTIAKLLFERTGDPLTGLWAAMIADRLGQTETRDELLKAVEARGPKYKANDHASRAGYIKLTTMFAKDLAAGGKAELDLDELEQACVLGSTHTDLQRFNRRTWWASTSTCTASPRRPARSTPAAPSRSRSVFSAASPAAVCAMPA